MQSNILLETKAGNRVMAYGYEAVARGALEADVKVVSGYPGTPSSGCLEALASVADHYRIHVEWSTNERVAVETAWGAAMNGQRSLVTMNHLGINVVMDPLKYSVNYGVTGGMVLFAGDDIGANTSAIESDSRVLGEAADLPVLTPSTPDEARIMTTYAFELSEELGCPVIVRSCCQLMMAQTPVQTGEIKKVQHACDFAPNPRRVVMMEPGTMPAVTTHRFMHDNLKKAGALLKKQGFDSVERQDGKLGLICCGVMNSIMLTAIERLGAEVSVLKLAVMNPLNEQLILDFARSVDSIAVLEEGEAFAELRIQAILERNSILKPVRGRLNGEIPFGGELFVENCEEFLQTLISPDAEADSGEKNYLPERSLTLCGGCAHMGVFYALRKTMEEVNGGNYLAFADAGCSFMGILPPAKSLNSATNMGGCISFASGVAHARDTAALRDESISAEIQPVFAVCGDGGFIHGGVSGLVNAVFNQANLIVLLLDNSTLGNTGLQPTGCTGSNATGKEVEAVNLKQMCESMGVPAVTEVDSENIPELEKSIREALSAPKPAVIVAKAPCVLNRQKEEKAEGVAPKVAFIDTEKCISCGDCKDLYCTAILHEDDYYVREDLCSGCKMCSYICPEDAIQLKEVSLS